MAITWKSMAAPNLAEAARPLLFAQQALANAFETAQGAIKDNTAFNEKLWKRQDTEATQDVVSKLLRAQTVNEFNALNQSGVLDQRVAPNGARVDMSAINPLRDGRLSTLQQRELQGLKFGEEKAVLEQAPATAEGMAIAQRQDPVAFAAWLEANPQNRKMSDVLGLNRTVQQSVEDQGFQKNQDTRAGTAEERAAALHPLTLDQTRAATEAARTNAKANLAQANASAANTQLAGQERLERRLTDVTTKIADLTEKNIPASSPAGQESIVKKIIDSTKDDAKTRNRLLDQLPVLLNNPEFANANASVVSTALLSDVDPSGWFGIPWNTSGDKVETKLKALLSNVSPNQSTESVANIKILKEQQKALREGLYGSKSPK